MCFTVVRYVADEVEDEKGFCANPDGDGECGGGSGDGGNSRGDSSYQPTTTSITNIAITIANIRALF